MKKLTLILYCLFNEELTYHDSIDAIDVYVQNKKDQLTDAKIHVIDSVRKDTVDKDVFKIEIRVAL